MASAGCIRERRPTLVGQINPARHQRQDGKEDIITALCKVTENPSLRQKYEIEAKSCGVLSVFEEQFAEFVETRLGFDGLGLHLGFQERSNSIVTPSRQRSKDGRPVARVRDNIET